MNAKVITIAGERKPFIVIKEPVRDRVVVISGVQGAPGTGSSTTVTDYSLYYNLAKGE